MILYVVRHGETEWNRLHKVQGRTDIPLNDYGRHLARETAEGMKSLSLDLAYTSPLSRARETAGIILEGRNIPIIEDERIQEFSFGSMKACIAGERIKIRKVWNLTAFLLIRRIIFRRKTERRLLTFMKEPEVS